MSYQSLFIYQLITTAATYVVIAHNVKEAQAFVICPADSILKLGCVTADVIDHVEAGVVAREWRSLE